MASSNPKVFIKKVSPETIVQDYADLMDMAASRGQNMTLQQAYDKSIQLHPEITQVISE